MSTLVHAAFGGIAHRVRRRRCAVSRRILCRQSVRFQLDVICRLRLLFPAVSRPIRFGVLRRCLRSCSEKERLECRDAAANDAHISFNGRPNPDVEPFPGNVKSIVHHIVHPICTEASSNNDNATDSEEDHESDPLRRRQREVE